MAEDLPFLHMGFTQECIARVNKHFDGYFTLQFMSAGGIELFYDNRAYTLEGSWFWPAMPGPHIRFHPWEPKHEFWTHRYVAFKGPLVQRWHAAGLYPDGPVRSTNVKRDVKRFDELLAQARRGGRWGTLRGANILESTLLELAESHAQPQQREPWLERVMSSVQRLQDSDYAGLARNEGMALSTLRRRFRRATGTALHTYALQCRAAEARRLLGETDLPVKTIAENLGYNDVFFFSRQFRKMTGTSPAAYRRSRQ
jgi:AraC family transcriptional regulator of arabinose operon